MKAILMCLTVVVLGHSAFAAGQPVKATVLVGQDGAMVIRDVEVTVANAKYRLAYDEGTAEGMCAIYHRSLLGFDPKPGPRLGNLVGLNADGSIGEVANFEMAVGAIYCK